MKHIGIAAVTAEGAALCYRTICSEAMRILGNNQHPEISLHTHSFQKIVDAQRSEDWQAVASLLLSSLQKLKTAGADFAIIPANSVHFVFDELRKKSPLPLLSIVTMAADLCAKRSYQKVLVLGVGITMSRGLFTDALTEKNIQSIVPTPDEQEKLNRIIYEEIVPSVLTEISRQWIIALVLQYKVRGCDSVLLGCTELPLILTPETSPLPTIDTTRELGLAALHEAMDRKIAAKDPYLPCP